MHSLFVSSLIHSKCLIWACCQRKQSRSVGRSRGRSRLCGV